MKKILEHGYNTYQTRCYKCSCLFSYELEDINKDCLVTCPECGSNEIHSPIDKVYSSKILDKEN